ncbi:zinc ribbon domain-containing protein [Marinicrinis lubricantis]|uniref:Zinc ribbon domain-containing protein n=1 Tax=Marinicrinis lubricantis TaxID=2086470 RepID=A0ABW1IVM5_9BACL
MKYCQQCGAERVQGQKFCGSCGAKFIETVTQQQVDELQSAQQENEQRHTADHEEHVVEEAFVAEKHEGNERTEQIPRYVKVEQESGDIDTQGQVPPSEHVSTLEPNKPKAPGTQTAQFKVHSKKKLSKKIWIPAFIVLLIAAIAVTGWILGSKYSSAEYAIDRLEQAVDDKDAEELLNLLVSEDKQWKLDEEQAESFIQALDGHGDFREELFAQLREEAGSSSSANKIKVFESMGGGSSDSSFLTLKKEGKQWFFFDRYVFEVQPFYMDVSTNLEDTVLSINGKEVATADEADYEEQFGPYMPGVYEVTAQLETEYGPIETTKDVELFSDSVQRVDLFLNADYVMIYSNEYDAVLWANEEEIGTIPSDGLLIGPLAVDGTVSVRAIKDYGWGTAESEEYIIEDAADVYLELNPLNEDVKAQLYDTLNDFAVSWIQAYTQMDANLLLNVTDEQRQFHKDDMDAVLNQGLLITGTAEYTTYDADSFSYFYDEWDTNEHYVSVDMMAEYLMSVYYQGEEPILEIYQYPWTVYLIYDSATSRWLVDGVEDLYDFYPYEPVDFELSGI